MFFGVPSSSASSSAASRPDPSAGPSGHPLTVANTTFLLERLSLEAGPTLFARELTRNAIDASAKRVVWDLDWGHYGATKIPKLTCIDDGEGMTAAELVAHFGSLFSTGRTLDHDANFGVGGKISTAVFNPAGVEVRSWRAGRGHVVLLRADPASGEFGLAPIGDDGGPVREATPDERPDLIGDHGTMIVLHGETPDAVTADPPAGVRKRSTWLWGLLNRRFFDVDESVTVEVRLGTGRRRSVTQHELVEVPGMRATLAAAAETGGTVALTGGRAHWWVLPAGNTPEESGLSGHVGLLFQGEIYDRDGGPVGAAKLQRLGVLVGANRVVVYIEPDGGGGVLSPNTARTHLLLDSGPLPWPTWEAEFAAALPGPIAELMTRQAVAAADSYRAAIRRRLRAAAGESLFALSAHVPADRLAAARQRVRRREAAGRGGGGDTRSKKQTADRKAEARRLGVTEAVLDDLDRAGAEDRFEDFTEVAATAAEAADDGDFLPSVTWVSAADGTRVAGDLEDRPARYVRSRNALIVNRDYRGWQDQIERWASRYPSPAARLVIEAKVREWGEQMLCEAVLAALELTGRPEWPDEAIETLLDPTGLTNALGPRLTMHERLRSELGAALGASKCPPNNAA
jgi:hypothetical protein